MGCWQRKGQRGRTCRHNLKDVPAGDTANEVGSGRRMAVLREWENWGEEVGEEERAL